MNVELKILSVLFIALNTYFVANQINDRAVSKMDKYLPKKKYKKKSFFWFYKKNEPVRWLAYWIERITQIIVSLFWLCLIIGVAIYMTERNSMDMGETKENNTNEQLKVLKLHIELDMKYIDTSEREILMKYGSMKESISRDILVPSDITLHALNYAILRMFGWQNSHLHQFCLPEVVFDKLTEGDISTWTQLAGVYFRYPTEDYPDIYWDDDYKGRESIRTWMKRKYTGPYKYNGFGEHYLTNQMYVKKLFSVERAEHSDFSIFCRELLERLPLADVLYVSGEGEPDYNKIREGIGHNIAEKNTREALIWYERYSFANNKQRKEYLVQHDIQTVPVTDQLCYRYDYSDGWEVMITCDTIFHEMEHGKWVDHKGRDAEAMNVYLEDVVKKHRPICIEKDGIELIDDVGGISGFCRMLQIMNNFDTCDEEEKMERESMYDWAWEMGWMGRRISPKQTL